MQHEGQKRHRQPEQRRHRRQQKPVSAGIKIAAEQQKQQACREAAERPGKAPPRNGQRYGGERGEHEHRGQHDKKPVEPPVEREIDNEAGHNRDRQHEQQHQQDLVFQPPLVISQDLLLLLAQLIGIRVVLHLLPGAPAVAAFGKMRLHRGFAFAAADAVVI